MRQTPWQRWLAPVSVCVWNMAQHQRAMSVLHVIGSTAFAGTERHVLGLASELQRLGCSAAIACPSSARTLTQQARKEAVAVRSWRSALRLRVDVVHVHDGRSMLFGVLLAGRGRAALVRTQHFVQPASALRKGMTGWLSLQAHRLFNRRLDGYIAVSDAALRAASARNDVVSARTAVVPPGITLPPDELMATAREERARVEHPTVVSAGRLEPERHFHVLIEAIPLVRARHPGVQCVIAGAGSAEAELKMLAARLAVDQSITWTGWLPELSALFRNGHIYVNTWPLEGFGMATAEAMSFAMPVVAIASGASAEVVDPGSTGLLVPPENPSALAAAITDLLDDPSRATTMGIEGRTRAKRSYSIQHTAAAVLNFYTAVAREVA